MSKRQQDDRLLYFEIQLTILLRIRERKLTRLMHMHQLRASIVTLC